MYDSFVDSNQHSGASMVVATIIAILIIMALVTCVFFPLMLLGGWGLSLIIAAFTGVTVPYYAISMVLITLIVVGAMFRRK